MADLFPRARRALSPANDAALPQPAPQESDARPQEPPLRPLSHHLALTVYWLSNSLLWGALLHLGLQSRLSDWYGQETVGYYLGLLGFAGGAFGMAAQVVAGAASDRSRHPWGRRRPFMVAGGVGACAALMALGAARSYWPFVGAMILLQVFSNAALAPFAALLPDTVSAREHGKASGFMGAARLAGDVGGLVLAASMLGSGPVEAGAHRALLRLHDQQFLLMCALVAGLLAATLVFTCWRIRERPLLTAPAGRLPADILGPFRVDIRGNPDFFWLWLSRGVTNFGFYIFLEILFFFVKYTLGDAHPEVATRSIMWPAVVAAAASSAPAGMLSDRRGRRKLVLVSQLTVALAGAAFLVAPNLLVARLAGIPAGLAFGAFASVEWALACDLLPAGGSGRYLAVWNASLAAPQLLAFPLAGAFGSAISARVPGLGWRLDFALAVLCCLVGAYFLGRVHETVQPPNETARSAEHRAGGG